MATIQKFEDLLCWQKARLLTKEVYMAFKDNKDYGFKDQIQRASVSVMSNVAEGFERGTTPEFINYLFIAKGSAGEVRAQLYAAYDIGYLNIQTFKNLNAITEECSRLIQSFSEKVKSSSIRGTQFKRTEKKDPLEEFTKEHSQELYEKFYGNKNNI